MKFKPGDVCAIVAQPGCRLCQPYHGMQCTVETPVAPHPMWARCCTGVRLSEPAYGVGCANGEKIAVEESQLRLIRPPGWDKWIFDTRDVEREQSTPVEIANAALLRMGAV